MLKHKRDLEIFDVFSDPIMAIDEDEVIVYQNDASYELFGKYLVKEQFSSLFVSPLLRCAGKGVCSLTYGKITYAAVKSELGNYRVITVLGVESPKPWTSFEKGVISVICKNLNNTLTWIKEAGRVIKNEMPGDEIVAKCANKLDHSDLTLSRMAHHLDIVFSKKFPEKLTNIVSIDVRDVFEMVISTAAEVAGIKNISVDFCCDEEVVHFFGNKELTIELLLNLVSNGIKFNGAGGKVTVELRGIFGGIEFKVIDSGIGIPRKKLLNILSFNEEDVEKTGGMNLGLHICCKIAELHKGGLYIESDEGGGTTVTVILMNGKPTPTGGGEPNGGYDTDDVLVELSDLLSHEEYLQVKRTIRR